MNKLHNVIGKHLRKIDKIKSTNKELSKTKIEQITDLRIKIRAIAFDLQKGKGW